MKGLLDWVRSKSIGRRLLVLRGSDGDGVRVNWPYHLQFIHVVSSLSLSFDSGQAVMYGVTTSRSFSSNLAWSPGLRRL